MRIAVWCLLGAGVVHGQIITTIAGTSKIFPSSGLRALNAQIAIATLAADNSGNVYIADAADNVVLRVAPDGALTVVAGNGIPGYSGDGGAATSASIDGPYGLAVDSEGSLYIADSNNNRIRKVSGGIITTFAGGGNGGDGSPAEKAQLIYPLSVAIDSKDNVYIADTYNYKVRVVTNGIMGTIAGTGADGFTGDGGPALKANLYADKVAVDGAGNVYVVSSDRIRKISNGTIVTVAGGGKEERDGGLATNAVLSGHIGLAVDTAGNIYIGDTPHCSIRVVSGGVIGTAAGNGSAGFAGDGGPATGASFGGGDVGYCTILEVAVDSKGKLYIGDGGNNHVRTVTNGVISTIAGNGLVSFSGDGGPATSALLNGPEGIAVDANGAIYFSDADNGRIRRIAKGIITTIAGNGKYGFSGDGGPATSASLAFPKRVALDAAGNIYFADYANNRIRKISGGTITTVAGSDEYQFSGDGGPATKAGLTAPQSVAVDAAGNLYITDSGNNRIRKVTNGVISTIAGGSTAGFSGDGGPASNALLDYPVDIALDAAGNIYVADYQNHRVRKIANGVITTVAGNGKAAGPGDGGLAVNSPLAPDAIAVDAAGTTLYIDDLAASTVRKVASGIITTVAGAGTFGFTGDGGLATLATFGRRYVVEPAIALDSSGNLYIADTFNNRIREVLALKPTFQSAPSTLTFSASARGAAPPPQSVNVTSSIAGVAFTALSSAPWLAVNPAAGSLPAVLLVTADPASLDEGSYTGTVTFTAPSAATSTSSVSVTFTVKSAAPPSLGVDTQSVSFTALTGGTALTQQVNVTNTGGGSLAFTATAETASGGPWLAISPASGNATPASPAPLTITAAPGNLAAGTYAGTVTISGAGTTLKIPVTLSVTATTSVILLSQSALTFTAVAQGGAPLPQSFGILNTGRGAMSWTATAQTLSGGSNWLSISSTSGTVTQPYLDVSLVNVAVDPSGLAAGNYFGRVQVSAAAVNSPQILTVVLNVLPAGSNPGPELRPSGMIFTGTAGSNPGSQDVTLGNLLSQTRTYVSTSIGSTFSYLPANASVAPSQPATVRVFPDFRKVSPGQIERGVITLLFDDGTPRNVSILTIVAPSAGNRPDSGSFASEPLAACSSSDLEIQFRSLSRDFVALVGQATTIEIQVTDHCGNLVGPEGPSGLGVQATFSNGDAAVRLTHIGNGIWTGTWRPVRGAGGPVLVAVTAFQIQGSSSRQGQVQLSGSLSTGSGAPIVTAGGVVNGASFAAGVPIAPGGLVTIYGANLASASGTPGSLPLPQQLNGTQVRMGGAALPLLYTSAGQVNVQVPFDMPVNTQFQMTVQRESAISVPESLVVAPAQPGVFSLNQQGNGQGVILKSDQITFALPATPAVVGETIVIYCAGLGPVNQAVAAGVPAPSSPPATTINPVTVLIDGQSATVNFAGLTPGFAGLYQVNAVVPSGVRPGDAVPVILRVGGQTSPPVTMAIR